MKFWKIYSGVQMRIKQLNSKSLIVPSANHSLNFSRVHSFGSAVSNINFFGALENV